MASKRSGYFRAYAPKRDMATKKARQDVAKKYGENAKNYDSFGIMKKVNFRKKHNLKVGEIDDYFKKRYNKHYKEK